MWINKKFVYQVGNNKKVSSERFLSTFSQDIPLASLLLWRGIYPFRQYRFLEYVTSCDWRCCRMNRFVTAPLMQLWDKALNVGKLSPQIYFICIKYYTWQSVYPRGKLITLWYSYPWTSISNITKIRMLYIYYICFKHFFVNKNKVLFSEPKSCRNEHFRNMNIFHSKLPLSRTRWLSRLSDWVIDTPASYSEYLNFDSLLRSRVSFLQFFLCGHNRPRPVGLAGLEHLLR